MRRGAAMNWERIAMKDGHSAIRNGLLAIVAVLIVGPGAAVGDDNSQGCVDCHVQKQGTTDLRLGPLLDQIGHGPVERSRNIPRDCIRCHRSSDVEELPPFSDLIHSIHYDVPKTNTFVTKNGGDCRECHAMDADEGKATVKGGKKNW
jgi:hypothetical protein